jgi:hypothetical protein
MAEFDATGLVAFAVGFVSASAPVAASETANNAIAHAAKVRSTAFNFSRKTRG